MVDLESTAVLVISHSKKSQEIKRVSRIVVTYPFF
jgi:hypothetical protein